MFLTLVFILSSREGSVKYSGMGEGENELKKPYIAIGQQS